MDRSHIPSVIQGDVELHDISASPSVELSHLLTPSLPDDKLQAEISLDFDGSCNAHDSVLGSSFPLGRESDVSMGEDECLDLSVTPSFETGLSDYAPTCFDSGTITHSIHTHPVCAVSESVSSFIGKDAHTDRSQQDSVASAQILSASPFILGSTSAANFVNAVLENLQSRSSGVLQPTPSIISVAPGIFVLNTLGTPGIIDLPLRTNPSNDLGTGVPSAFQTAVTLAHNNLEVQQLQNRDSNKLNSFVTSNMIKLEIRTVPFSEQYPLVTSDDRSTVLPSNINLPLSLTPETFCENISSSSRYLAFDGNLIMPTSVIQADNVVQLEDRNMPLEETYCHVVKEKESGIGESMKTDTQTDMCSDSNVDVACKCLNKKDTQTSTCTNEDGKYDNMILETVMRDGVTESPCNDLNSSSLMCSVEGSLWSDVDRFCTFSGKSGTESIKNIQENVIPLPSNVESCRVKHPKEDIHTQDKIKLVETILNSHTCKIIQDSPVQRSGIVTTFKTVIEKEKDLASLMTYVKNLHGINNETASGVEGSCTEMETSTNLDTPVSSSMTMSACTTREEEAADEDGVFSEQLSWDGCSSGEIQPATRVSGSNIENSDAVQVDNTDKDKRKSKLKFKNNDGELNTDKTREDTPVLETSPQHHTAIGEASTYSEVKTKTKTGECSALKPENNNISTPFPPKVPVIADEGHELMTCTLESGGQTDQDIGEQDTEQTTESGISECELCNATFTRPGNYKRHLKLHDFKHWNNNRYKCDKCGRSFLQHCDLKRHTLIHENREPYKCSVCGKGYIRKSDLVVHLRFHNKEKVFKCDQCSKSYYQNGDLKRHMRTHTRQELLICAYCGRKLARQTTLLQHMQTKHKDIIIETFQSVEKHKQVEDCGT
ncbi:uncharacterized protein LOC121384519 [Gigantopelta aegis]|uniref:uncharacterized protein LOC121384519 n=1 Tax=Gigantopelta aegis TaxID=1735272 RepID=UPI001B88AFBF|nr:uncharacterized protein LOC121384519 [Gigantopelta aegis]